MFIKCNLGSDESEYEWFVISCPGKDHNEIMLPPRFLGSKVKLQNWVNNESNQGLQPVPRSEFWHSFDVLSSTRAFHPISVVRILVYAFTR